MKFEIPDFPEMPKMPDFPKIVQAVTPGQVERLVKAAEQIADAFDRWVNKWGYR